MKYDTVGLTTRNVCLVEYFVTQKVMNLGLSAKQRAMIFWHNNINIKKYTFGLYLKQFNAKSQSGV